jgi:single-strand DNA-binding protein
MNKVLLVGRLGHDVETRSTPNGSIVANFSMATTETRRTKSGGWEKFPEWHSIVVWDQTAEFLRRFGRKGAFVSVEGTLRTRKWEDKDGTSRSKTEIVASSVQMITWPADEGHPQHDKTPKHTEPSYPPEYGPTPF